MNKTIAAVHVRQTSGPAHTIMHDKACPVTNGNVYRTLTLEEALNHPQCLCDFIERLRKALE